MKKFILALAALTLGSPVLAAPPTVPSLDPTTSVVDAARLLSPEQEEDVNELSRQIYNVTHHHVVVLTMPSLDGADPKQYATNAFNTYRVGNWKRDDGVLLLVSMGNPRRIQIAVGDGLTDVLSDQTAENITKSMVPSMKTGNYYDAIYQGVDGIGGVVMNKEVSPSELAATAGNPTGRPVTAAPTDDSVILPIILVTLLLAVGFWALLYFAIIRPRQLREQERARIAAEERRAELLAQQARDYQAQQKRNSEREAEEELLLEKRHAIARKTSQNFDTTPTRPSVNSRNAAAVVAAEQARQSDRRRQSDEEDRQRRQREDDDRRSRDNSSTYYSSSSNYDSSPSPSSFDSGGSSSGGGGGSDF